MTVYLAPSFRWISPRVDVRAVDGPTEARSRVELCYDPIMGRLGSRTLIALEGSTGSTRFNTFTNTEFWVRAELHADALRVEATLRCVESGFDAPIVDDEFGFSSFGVEFTSRTYAFLVRAPDRRGAEVYCFDEERLLAGSVDRVVDDQRRKASRGLRGFSDDITFEATLASNWLLEQLDVVAG